MAAAALMTRRVSIRNHHIGCHEHRLSVSLVVTHFHDVTEKESTEKWELSEEKDPGVAESYIVGRISDDEVAMRKLFDSSLYVSNLRDSDNNVVVSRGESSNITSCAPLPDGRIVSGIANSTLEIYDKERNLERTIGTEFRASAHVAVDRRGKILATGWGGSTIHVYDPRDGRRIKSNYVADNIVIFQIHALPSGNIAMRTRCDKGDDVCILSDWGLTIAHLHDKEVLSIAPRDCDDDSVFVLHSDHMRTTFAVDILSFSEDGEEVISTQRIVDRKMDKNESPSFAVPTSNKLVVGLDGKLCVFENANASASLHNEV